MKLPLFLIIVMFCAAVFTPLNGQGRVYSGPDDPAGDVAAERAGYMTGNRVLLFFRNTTELSDCCGLGNDVSKWPNNYDGTKMHDGIATLIGARVYLENDSIPVTDINEIRSRNDLDTLFYIESSYREHMDLDPTQTIEYGLYPIFGYFNELSETPAMSNRPESWPALGWPVNSSELKWAGEWNGRFGRGVMKADLECFFVVNDAHDLEYLQEESEKRYYPRRKYDSQGNIVSEVKIGDKNPNVTIHYGKPWGGIGTRVETRGFQWSNPAATDAIFWEYNIANISEYDLPEMVFGFWMDNAVGGEEGVGDDLAFYDKNLNMSYSWDIDFIPVGAGKEPGILGFAYLESPGLAYDGMDNDNDGLVDEKRDNPPGNKVGPYDGIVDLDKFLEYYKLEEGDLKEHFEGDEDQDWNDGVDLNGDGAYAYLDAKGEWQVQEGEDPGDDVGLDGVGPFDVNYNGPDADGSECNHKPDFIEGVGAEPNFASTDISESDMLGLTSFHYTVDLPYECVIREDKNLFTMMSTPEFMEFQSLPLNFMEFFASGLFPLYKGRTERISMSELHSYDPLAGLMASGHEAPALFRLKEVVQAIYETDYRFAQPPHTPTLSATPADGKVILSWDDMADTKTRDAFVNYANDFEGYKIYRATDKKMSDAEVITDGYGNPIRKKPIYQCDIVDNITGFASFGAVNGVEYFLGNDTGIKHYFVDNTVMNGRTYYYVLVAYDYGVPDVGEGISPSENSYVLELDESEEVRKISKNTAIVTPAQYAIGYTPPYVEDDEANHTLGCGKVKAEVVLFDKVKANHTYKVKFHVDTVHHLRRVELVRHPRDMFYVNSGFSVYDVTDSNSLVYSESKDRYSGTNLAPGEIDLSDGKIEYKYFNEEGLTSGIFDGTQINIHVPFGKAKYNPGNSGWVVGDSPMELKIHEGESAFFPWEYNIVFTDNDTAYTSRLTKVSSIYSADNTPLGPASVILGSSFNFYVVNKTFQDSTGNNEKLDLLAYDVDRNGVFDYSTDKVLVGHAVDVRNKVYWGGTVFELDFSKAFEENNMPKPNDLYQVDFFRPFMENDSILFTVKPEVILNKDSLKNGMDKIKVVPNPYIMTNVMEASVANYQLNQRRRILFTHLPARCEIKIFTVSGVLVDEIKVDNSFESRGSDWDLNSPANGTAHWDLKTKEGLEIAPGYYIYHVKSTLTGDEKFGKFAVIK